MRPKDGMFAIIITEKGGTERREVFDRTEINVGRVQGNELMLPKGNVSKHHARLLYRDGRFIVTDLKSTNGTYVNGRKITQATIVREGDKIYIGDFILRLEIPPQQAPQPQGLPEEAVEQISSSRNPPQEAVQSRPPAIRASQEGPVSHYPLENDPDEQSWSGDQPPQAQPQPQPQAAVSPSPQPAGGQLRMPAPPRLPSAAQPRRSNAPSARASGPNVLPLSPAPAAEVSSPPMPAGRPSSPSSTGRAAQPPREPSGHGTHDSMQVPAQRITAVSIVTRVEEAMDLAPLRATAQPPKPLVDRIDRAVREAANAMRSSGDMPPQVDLEAVVAEAREEILGIGPLETLFADEDVVEIHIHRHAWVSTLRASGPRRTETPFASEPALDRILRRLCARDGAPVKDGEVTVERNLQGGLHLLALLPPAAQSGSVATIRKCAQATVNLDDLVRSGAMSRAVASFLTQVVAGQANMLLNASNRGDMFNLLSAVLSAVRPSEHLVLAHTGACRMTLPRNATELLLQPGEKGAEVLRSAARLSPDRLVVAGIDGALAAEVLDAVASGAQGVMVATSAPTVRHAFARLVPDCAAHRPGVPIEALREWVNASFDVAVEYTRMRDGRARVVRVSEPAGVEGRVIAMRDIFTFNVERTASGGAVEGSFHPTGVVPKIVEDLQARGLTLDPSLFRR